MDGISGSHSLSMYILPSNGLRRSPRCSFEEVRPTYVCILRKHCNLALRKHRYEFPYFPSQLPQYHFKGHTQELFQGVATVVMIRHLLHTCLAHMSLALACSSDAVGTGEYRCSQIE